MSRWLDFCVVVLSIYPVSASSSPPEAKCPRPIESIAEFPGCFETEIVAPKVERTKFGACVEVYERRVLCFVDGKEDCVVVRTETPTPCELVKFSRTPVKED